MPITYDAIEQARDRATNFVTTPPTRAGTLGRSLQHSPPESAKLLSFVNNR